MERDTQMDWAFQENQGLHEDRHASRASCCQSELERAKRELEEESHKPLGLFDDLINLLCWIETPEERLHKNRLAKVTLSEVGRHARKGAGSKAPGIVGSLANRMVLALAKAV